MRSSPEPGGQPSAADIPTHAPAVRRAGAADRTEVARVLSSAFLDDPVFAWLVPDRDERTGRLPAVFDAFAEAYARHGESHVLTADEETPQRLGGVALWAPPGAEPVHPEDEERFGVRLVEATGPHVERFAVCGELFAAVHPAEPSWYLGLLGVDADQRGRGLGSALLRDTLAVVDLARQPAYLEATSPRNRVLYERHGFRHLADVPLPGGPTAYAMWRDPAAASR